jgi:hypothetical protein
MSHCKNPACKELHYKIGLYKYHYKAKTELIKTKKYVIKSVSYKQHEKLKEYRILRDAYMEEHKLCEVCTKYASNDLHHKCSRGKHLCNINTFMAVCRACHERIHREDSWARENGYLLSKLF